MRARLTCAMLAAAAGAATLAQAPQQPTFRLEANYVRVDLYASQGDQALQDLRQEEIELLEDGVPQKIEAFEHITIRPAGAQEQRVDPPSPSRTRTLAEDPRARVLVLFLDTLHVQLDGSHNMRQPLANLLDHVVGEDDLVGLMHPRMSARDLTLGRKTIVLSRVVKEEWTWGEKQRGTPLDSVEEQWFNCYGFGDRLDEMRARRREKMALDALEDLVTHLRGLREERKAVLLVSEGWRLFGDNQRLAGLERGEEAPRGPGIFVGPSGRLGTRDQSGPGAASKADCDAARMELAAMDSSRRLRELVDHANRANVSFYPVYPRGLQVTETPIATHRSAEESRESLARLSRNLDQLRELATNTDGLAVVNTNDISGAMRRIVADLTSYYLLGYYSTNTRPDGKFRSIVVRVKRPGVKVRARRGYRALTRAEAAHDPSRAPASTALLASIAVNGILHRPDEGVNPLNLASLRHVVMWKRGPSTGRNYVSSEDPRLRRTERLRLEHATDAQGAHSAQMLDALGRPMIVPVQLTERADVSGNYRWIVADVVLAPLAPGEYSIELTVGDLKVNTMFQIVP